MPEFHYTTKKELEPRPGTNFATTYYKQTQREYTRLRAHVYRVAAEFNSVCDSDLDYYKWAVKPLKGYKKSTKGEYYTPMEIVTDMLGQFTKQKDLPSGMLGRWSKLFADTPWDIRMVTGTPAKDTTYGKLFDYGQV